MSQSEAPHLDEAWLREQYWGEGLSIREMAEEAGAGYSSVRNSMKRRGVERREPGEALMSEPVDGFTEGEWREMGRGRRYYLNNRDRIRERDRSRARSNRKWLNEHKRGKECERCGYDEHIAALDFHHRPGEGKTARMARMIDAYSLDAVKKEVEKCVVLCANCHRVLHAEEGSA